MIYRRDSVGDMSSELSQDHVVEVGRAEETRWGNIIREAFDESILMCNLASLALDLFLECLHVVGGAICLHGDLPDIVS